MTNTRKFDAMCKHLFLQTTDSLINKDTTLAFVSKNLRQHLGEIS